MAGPQRPRPRGGRPARPGGPAATLAVAARWFEDDGQPGEALRLQLGSPATVTRCSRRGRGAAPARGDRGGARRSGPDRPGATLAVHRLEGDARQLSGDWDGALACYDKAAWRRPAGPGLAWRMGLIHHLRGDPATALAVYGRGDREAVARGGRCRPAGVLDRHRPLAARRRRPLPRPGRRGHDLARASRDDRALAAAHTVQALAAALDGDRLANDGHYLRALDHAERVATCSRWCASGSTAIAAQRGGLLRRGHRRARPRHRPGRPGRPAAPGHRPVQPGEAHGLGRLELAVDDLDRATAVFQRLGSMMVGLPAREVGQVHAARGRTALARAAFTEAAEVSRTSGDAGAGAGARRPGPAAGRRGPGAARACADEAVAVGPVLGHVDALLAQAWCALAAGDPDEGCRSPSGRRWGGRRDRAALAEVAEVRAAVLARDDAPGRATRPPALDDALALWDELGSPLGQGRVLLAQAELGGPGVAGLAREAEARLRSARRPTAGGAGRAAVRGGTGGPSPPVLAIHCLGGFAAAAVRRAGGRRRVELPQGPGPGQDPHLPGGPAGPPLGAGRGAVAREDPARTGSRLSVTLSTARAVLDPGKAHPPGWFLAAEGDAVWIDVDHVDVDVLRFGALVAAAEAERKGGPTPAAQEALAGRGRLRGRRARRGPLRGLVGVAPGAGPGRLHLGGLYAGRRHRRRGRHGRRRALLPEGPGAGPYDEHAHLGLVATQLAAGQQGEARRSYRAYGLRMEEIGVEASPFPG